MILFFSSSISWFIFSFLLDVYCFILCLFLFSFPPYRPFHPSFLSPQSCLFLHLFPPTLHLHPLFPSHSFPLHRLFRPSLSHSFLFLHSFYLLQFFPFFFIVYFIFFSFFSFTACYISPFLLKCFLFTLSHNANRFLSLPHCSATRRFFWDRFTSLRESENKPRKFERQLNRASHWDARSMSKF